MRAHRIAQHERAVDVVLVVLKGIFHRFAHSFQAGEMNDRFDSGLSFEQLVEAVAVAHVDLVETGARTRDCLNAVERFELRIAQVVGDDNIVAVLDELDARMRADKARAACYQNRSRHGTPFALFGRSP